MLVHQRYIYIYAGVYTQKETQMDSKAIPKTDGLWKFGISIQTGQNTVIEQVSWVIFTQKHEGPLCEESPEDYSDLPKEEATLHIL